MKCHEVSDKALRILHTSPHLPSLTYVLDKCKPNSRWALFQALFPLFIVNNMHIDLSAFSQPIHENREIGGRA